MGLHKIGLRGLSALIMAVWVLGCSAAGSEGDAEHPSSLIGTWRASFGAFSGEYSEQFEFRADGTASRVRKTPGWSNVADANSWISVYECDWSVSRGKTPSFADPWKMQQVCEEVSHTEPTEGQGWSGDFTRLPLATSPVSTMKIIAISRLAFTEAGGHGDPDFQDHEYARVHRR